MEKLTSSRSVIDIYAFCGMSVVTEFAKLSVRHAAKKMNSVEKLDVAVQVARGLAAVHSIDNSKRASLVHNDITSANVVVTLDNRAVLNDFNTAILQTVHNETGEVCPFYSHYPNPQWRSPEEQVGLQKSMPIVTEKVDLYGLGNVLFVLAVGIKPWMKSAKAKISPEERDLISHVKLFNGTIPGVPMRIQRSRDPAIQALLKAMYKCYRFDPKERPSARNIADLLESEAMVVFPHFNYTPVLGLTGI
jgi:serine/threonine protein kinase